MSKNRILIVNDGQDAGHSYSPLFEGFGSITHDKSSFKLNPGQFKLIQFTGGADVTPSLYGDTSPNKICRSDYDRDAEEFRIFKVGLQNNVKMAGICRGMQFLNVMSGGKLIHHIQGHAGVKHDVHVSSRTKYVKNFRVNSLHHQMCIPHKRAHILAWSAERLSAKYIGDGDEDMDWLGPEVEGFYHSFSSTIGVQWHPEAMRANSEGRLFYTELVRDFVNMMPIGFENKYLGSNVRYFG
jgi:gamma-glutamyl-gamma-aminobutyrate hydrolase PuuD